MRAPPAAGAGNRSRSRPALPPQRPVARETPPQLGSGVAAAAAAAAAARAERPAQELGLFLAARGRVTVAPVRAVSAGVRGGRGGMGVPARGW